jgi:predicted nucleic acid-binding protein
MTGDVKPVFIDTNILVYASTARSPLHQVARQALQQQYDAGAELWINRQILREYLATLTRSQSFTDPLPIETLLEEIQLYQSRFRIAEDNAQVTASLLALTQQVSVGGKQIHDANIVATMQVYSIDQLLTRNTIDFARFAAFVTILPLVKLRRKLRAHTLHVGALAIANYRLKAKSCLLTAPNLRDLQMGHPTPSTVAQTPCRWHMPSDQPASRRSKY